MNYYEHYKIARDASWRTILECGITALPINMVSVAKKWDSHCTNIPLAA
ncbi:MAG: hypothetical protein GX299_07750 [Epulopiscium sp.]|jgi:hypothetical protein|nr:hypothetical protein [Candidatus Epulonipiscium sp.]